MSKVMDVGFPPGERIGNYRVQRELGPTGAGILIEAQHLVLPRRAILKVVHPAFAALQPYVLQMLREACMLEAIAHPGVPIVYESGLLRDRRPWFAFERITGATLAELLVPGALPVPEVAGLMRDLADLLDHAHRRGVIHRGLRPDRVVLTPSRRFPLCIPDWSEAIAHDATAHLPHASDEEVSSYMAPELAYTSAGDRHARIDERVDLFALGVIGYRALTGRLPFTALPDPSLFVSAHDRRPEAPRELTAIIDALLAFDRAERPSAALVRRELDRLREALPELSPRPAPAESAVDLERIELSEPRTAQDDVVLLDQPRLRRPRWTPSVRYLDTLEPELVLSDEDHER